MGPHPAKAGPHSNYNNNKRNESNHFLLSVSLGQKLPDVLTREGATTLVDLVVKAGLAETLNGDGPFTIFAPTNEAFEKLPQSDLEQLLANPEALKKVLLYHVIPAEIK